MKQKLLVFCLLVSLRMHAQELNLIPKPYRTEIMDGNFTLSAETKIFLASDAEEKSARFINDYLQKFYGFHLQIVKKNNTATQQNILVFSKTNMENPVQGAYTLTINRNMAVIGSADPSGWFYGVQTLIQLFPFEKKTKFTLPCLEIEDRPRFAYRGMHLDVGRHFFPVDFIKKYIDFIAMYKMNTFHWHLTEDQGWRIEIKKYPRLTEVGAYRNGTIIGHHPGTGNDDTRYGGFYTQEQIREIVKYAADRYITVIPEIELPGHASAAIAAYPELSCFPEEATRKAKNVVWSGDSTGKQVQQSWGVYPDVFCPSDYTFHFLENVLDEVMALFPSKYIHIGGDECPKDNWKRSAFCQQLIQSKNLKDEHGLQSYFIQRIEKYLNSKGRNIIGWDEILEGGLAPNATVMSWRGEKGGIEAAKQKHQVIMTPGGWVYFDHSQTKHEDSVVIGGYTPIQKVYGYEPVPSEMSEEDARYVLGAQANVWTEYMKYPSKVEYMIFPRMSALSEVLWTEKTHKDWSDFSRRLTNEFKRYDWWGVRSSKAYFDPVNQ
ncbi:MAG: beta-N-acetylhexosaminidase [Bacteroidota bacterium]|nr:beta-N-acetylhexosaminidase [Bacteroidota bacterium]